VNASAVLQQTLEKFVHSPAFGDVGIGEFRRFEKIRLFERPYSVQAIYRLVGTEGARNVYVKLFKNWRKKPESQFKQEIETEFHTIQFWYDQLKEFPDMTTFRPLFYDRDSDCIITEETPGKNLAILIQQNARFFPKTSIVNTLANYLFKAGRLLYHFQQKTRQDALYDYQTLIEDVDIRLKQLVTIPAAGFTESDRQQVLQFYQRHLTEAQKRAFPEVILHRDFGLGNLLVSGDAIVVHDFNRLEKGHPYFDFTRLYHQLEMLLYKPIYRPKVIRRLQDAYFRGYGFSEGRQDVVFNFFFLRHFFTHLLGLVRSSESSILSRLYSSWVKHRHQQYIRRIIQQGR